MLRTESAEVRPGLRKVPMQRKWSLAGAHRVTQPPGVAWFKGDGFPEKRLQLGNNSESGMGQQHGCGWRMTWAGRVSGGSCRIQAVVPERGWHFLTAIKDFRLLETQWHHHTHYKQ
jgi:hypothetical protein